MFKDIAYSSGFVSIKQQELLDADKVERMIRAHGTADTLCVLLECGYDNSILSKQPVDVDLLIENELQKTVAFLDEFCTDENLTVVCLKKFDYHNCKVFAKARHSNAVEQSSLYAVGLLGAEAIAQAVESKEYDQLPAPMAQALTTLGEMPNVNGRDIDIALDRAMFEDTSSLAKAIKSKNIREYFVADADICNIMTAVRNRRLGFVANEVANQFVAGGDICTQSLMVLLQETTDSIAREFTDSQYSEIVEKLCTCIDKGQTLDEAENELAEFLFCLSRVGMDDIFSNQPLFAWYIQKLMEFKTIRLIVVCKNNNMGVDAIKKRLRGIYLP